MAIADHRLFANRMSILSVHRQRTAAATLELQA